MAMRRKKFELWAPSIIRELQRRSVSNDYQIPPIEYSIIERHDIGFSYKLTDGKNYLDGDVALRPSRGMPTEILALGRGDATVIVSLDGLVAKFEDFYRLSTDPIMYSEFGTFHKGEQYPASRVVPALLAFFFAHYDIAAGQQELARRLKVPTQQVAQPVYRGPPLKMLPDMTPRGTR